MDITPNTPLEELPELLTVEEYGAYTRQSRASAYERVQTGKVPAIKLGRLWRVLRSGLIDMARPRVA
jgi:excisionase family DNA binding protein